MKLTFVVKYEPQWAALLRMQGLLLGVLGNQRGLGYWREADVVLMYTDNFRTWFVEVDADEFVFPLEYKYIIYDPENKKIVSWENRENRVTEGISFTDDKAVFTDEGLYFDLPLFRGAGVAIPVFSLRSNEGFGVGEFLDLKKMIDWAALTGLQLIQTLPINDTTMQHNKADSYPYGTLSVFALHPMYLRLQMLGELKNPKDKVFFEAWQAKLNALKTVDYETVNELKWKYFRSIYKQEGAAVLVGSEFKTFFAENEKWLLPYAVFSYMRDKEGTSDFHQWKELREYNETLVSQIYAKNATEVGLYLYLQFHLYKQLLEVHAYAKQQGVLLKGDIPIGVNPCSVDVWCNPKLFNLDQQAGAPPDDFSEKGQNWGFPTYNWDEMHLDGYAWWKERLKYMSTYFDAYRLDHILGFFRIWEIPLHAKWGLLGHFYPALPLKEENIEMYGLVFDADRFLKPFISDQILKRYFGDDVEEVKLSFLVENMNGNYDFLPRFDTQRKISAHFAAKKTLSAKDEKIRDGLYRLMCQVLFVKDVRHADHYHPRISCQSNEAYLALRKHEKEAYLRLYEDFFYHKHNELWMHQAMSKLPTLLNATGMLACGEDLGMIPACVPEVMKELNILSLEIQRMPKQYGQEFGVPYFAPYLSVCTTSTHDMSPIRLWWEEDRVKTQRYYNSMLFENGEAPAKCEPWITEKILWQHLQSPAMWVILPLQDWLAVDGKLCNKDIHAERINVPDNPKNVWCYRMHLDLDKLLTADAFNHKVKGMVSEGRR